MRICLSNTLSCLMFWSGNRLKSDVHAFSPSFPKSLAPEKLMGSSETTFWQCGIKVTCPYESVLAIWWDLGIFPWKLQEDCWEDFRCWHFFGWCTWLSMGRKVFGSDSIPGETLKDTCKAESSNNSLAVLVQVVSWHPEPGDLLPNFIKE